MDIFAKALPDIKAAIVRRITNPLIMHDMILVCIDWKSIIENNFNYSYRDQLPLAYNVIHNHFYEIKRLLRCVVVTNIQIIYFAILYCDCEIVENILQNNPNILKAIRIYFDIEHSHIHLPVTFIAERAKLLKYNTKISYRDHYNLMNDDILIFLIKYNDKKNFMTHLLNNYPELIIEFPLIDINNLVNAIINQNYKKCSVIELFEYLIEHKTPFDWYWIHTLQTYSPLHLENDLNIVINKYIIVLNNRNVRAIAK